jgi:hypothetical protein
MHACRVQAGSAVAGGERQGEALHTQRVEPKMALVEVELVEVELPPEPSVRFGEGRKGSCAGIPRGLLQI